MITIEEIVQSEPHNFCAHAAGSAHQPAARSFSLEHSVPASPTLAADTSDFYCGCRLQ